MLLSEHLLSIRIGMMKFSNLLMMITESKRVTYIDATHLKSNGCLVSYFLSDGQLICIVVITERAQSMGLTL